MCLDTTAHNHRIVTIVVCRLNFGVVCRILFIHFVKCKEVHQVISILKMLYIIIICNDDSRGCNYIN